MTTALESVKSGSVTFAVRDTKIDGVEIKKANSWDCQKAKLLQAMMMNLLPSLVCKSMLNEDSEILTIIAGEDANDDISDKLVEWVESEYPDVEVEEHNGGQPIYQYLFSVE